MIHDLTPYPAMKDGGVPWLGPVLACEHGSRQVIKLALAVQTAVSLSATLSVIAALPGDVRIGTVWALHAIRPSQLVNHREALFVV